MERQPLGNSGLTNNYLINMVSVWPCNTPERLTILGELERMLEENG